MYEILFSTAFWLEPVKTSTNVEELEEIIKEDALF